MTSSDQDGSGGLSQDEYYDFLTSMDGVGNADSYSQLDLMLKVSHKSLACYCTVLGDGEDCCVGEDAEVLLSVLETGDEVSAQYEAEVCETMAWALGMEGDEVAETTTTEAPTTEATVEAGSTAATATVGSTSTPDAGELPVTTEIPIAQDGAMTFTAVTTTIDFSSYQTLPESYDTSTYFDAAEVLSNSDDNGVLEDMQKGFVGLALDVFSELDGDGEMSVSMSMSEERQLRGRGVSNDRSLQDISFLIGGNLTTEVEDQDCPAALVYAPEGAPCLMFTYTITPAVESNSQDAFVEEMNSRIAEGDLYVKVKEISPDASVYGAGAPGGSGESFDSVIAGIEGDGGDDQEGGGLSTGAIIGIVVAVLAVPLAYLAYKSMNRDDQSTVPSAKHTNPMGGVIATSSDDEVAGTAARTATAVALKPDASTKLGFTYKMYPDQIVIASVKEGSIFHGTPLKEGNEIISINGQEVKGMDRTSFRSLLSNLPEGNVTIVMNEIVPLTILRVAAIKPEPTSKLGFTYKYIGNKIVVASVKEDGIFADTELRKGQEIVSINSKRVGGLNKDEFRGLLQSLPQGKVMISVKDIIEFSILKIDAVKPTKESKLGFMYKVLDDGVIVASVNDTGIFANTALTKGQEIVSINGKNVQKMKKDNFRAHLLSLPAGAVSFIVVDKPKKWSKSGTTLACTAVKETDESKLGFTYKVMKDGVTVESVGEYGLFSSTDLAPGQEIISVNGIPTTGLDRMEFREVLTSLKAGEVTLIVIDRSSKFETKGVVLAVEANKETETTKLGFTYKVLKNKVTVESVKPESIFGGTELSKGQEILSINGNAVRGMSRDQFREVLSGLSSGTVRLIVSDPFMAIVAKGGVLTISAEKVSDDTKLGFTYKVLRDNITIENVKEEGIFGSTELAPGQKIIRINGTPVKGFDRNAFRDLLGSLTAGLVTIDVISEDKKALQSTDSTVRDVTAAGEEVVAEDVGAPVEQKALTPEEEAHLQEVKKEVRVLVEQATPGKSAEDMLAQYEGREEELLSHLRKFVEKSKDS
jgi:C-terminal processing protease CtpA/Prc